MLFRRQAAIDRLPETINDKENTVLSLLEQFKKDVADKKIDLSGRKAFKLCLSIMVLHSSTELYAFMHYIVPYVFKDYGPWTHYYMNVLVWFIVMNMLVNWLCVMLYNPAYSKTKDNPFLNVGNQNDHLPDQFVARIEQAASQNGQCAYDITAKEVLPWKFCEKCSMHVPFRTHHCDVCKACILKRDHHCYMIGTCVGFNNQRYWIIVTFYTALNCLLCGFFTFKYARNVVWPSFNSWTDLILPVTLWRSVFGDIPAIHCIVIAQMHVYFLFGFLAFLYFNSQITISADGKTTYELAKKVPIKNSNSFNRNLKSVFGDFWGLNFLFPMTLIFRQKDDGIHWDGIKIDRKVL